MLNFTAYYVNVTYEWDGNGTEFQLVDPYDIVTQTDFELEHYLTIRLSDFYAPLTGKKSYVSRNHRARKPE